MFFSSSLCEDGWKGDRGGGWRCGRWRTDGKEVEVRLEDEWKGDGGDGGGRMERRWRMERWETNGEEVEVENG